MNVCEFKSKFDIEPHHTIADVKRYIRSIGYDPTGAKIILKDGTMVSPVVFESDKYDHVSFTQYRDRLKGSILILVSTDKINTLKVNDPDFNMLMEEIMNDHMYGKSARVFLEALTH